MDKVLEAIEKVGKRFEDYKELNDKRIAEMKVGELTAETKERLENVEKDLDKALDKKSFTEMKERLEKLEIASDRPNGMDSKNVDPVKQEYKEKFIEFIRSGGNETIGHELKEMARKAVTVGTPAAGGYAVPEDLSTVIHSRIEELSTMRNL